ncbi:hypothetical protein LVY72_05245 [Arthrobacter sp. I2-34]|uniref:Transposase n=1 Tax=Arthrobacter hankyongi TaxID=2904801 RepID=A0ABS9L430_9MICC|nr:hypothetical protein [Arthrobacter hankyongi]MCG2621318.1 hypothetical protein [Arthrobacter hankyongi]
MMLHDFPPWSTVYWYFQDWNADGTTEVIHDGRRTAARQAVGRDPAVPAGIIDAQTVRGADRVGRKTRGYDAGRNSNDRRRHVVTETSACRSWCR